MNEEEFDGLLYAALLEANRLDYQNMAENISVPWSKAYLVQRENMLDHPMRWYRNKRMPMWKRAGRTAAGFVLAFIVGFSALLVVSPTARAAFFAWVQEIYETYVDYQFIGEAMHDTLHYEILIPPIEYQEVDRYWSPGCVTVTYQNKDGQALYFDCINMEMGLAYAITRENVIIEDVIVNGCQGQLYLSTDEKQSSAVVWMDETQGIQFVIDAFIDRETLLYYAENVVEKNN